MGDAYPELRTNRETVERTILAEEHRFDAVLTDGLPRLEAEIAKALETPARVIPGDAAFRYLEAADDAQDGRLPGPVGAEQCDALAAVDLEVDVEEHLHRPVGEVGVDHLQHGCVDALDGALSLLLLFFE